ncbi:bifunctional transcriptional activator/DNA repair enzyme Ada [Eupeodes corollae]|uniref:bifunctional transcriptional activator/DNA repair enzyme Ada n=1 Tax=Eupeodes corollae TaxID=290404 RepID=UPI002492125A|nr:bifunctional transcriptional activator/DNA repair enzyme Ada [Eupeodes corollae]
MFTFEIASKKSHYNIKYGYADCCFGKCFVAFSNDAICHLHFVDKESKTHIQDLIKRFPEANLQEDTAQESTEVVDNIFTDTNVSKNFRLILQGTDFQAQVWQQLCDIPKGQTWSYEDVAVAMNKPKAIRPVANAVASNEIAFLIPCHRVIAKSGKSKYRWGSDRKISILEREGVHLG